MAADSSPAVRASDAGPRFMERFVGTEALHSIRFAVAGRSPVAHGYRMGLALRSSAFEDGSPIPRAYSHDHGDVSPPLSWDGVPREAVELVLLVDDPDAPAQGSFVHWVVFGLDPSRRGLAEGENPSEASSGVTGFGTTGYLGPAPPRGDRAHHYVFRLLALDQAIRLGGLSSYADVAAATVGHVLAEARLIGTYRR
jgi:Raf kinase inhibitor-like YbhB/YbcL family protein